MQIETKDFGTLDISPEDVIFFPRGLYAFEESKRFVVLGTKSKTGMMQLQSAEGPEPRFILLDPYAFVENYAPVFPKGTLESLGANDRQAVSVFVIAVIPGDIRRSTVNLKSPVVIHFAEKRGAQVILENEDYPVRFLLFPEEGEGARACNQPKAR